MVGVGGIGMSGLARILHAQGVRVTGSDRTATAITTKLAEEGILVSIGEVDLPESVDRLIYSEAVPTDDLSRRQAQERGVESRNYFQALGDWAADKKVIAIAGTHGKSTTTAMLGLILLEAGLDPTVLVGTNLKEFGGRNVHLGASDWLVVEACEYRRNFMVFHPEILGILNMEWDHPDSFPSFADYQQAFADLSAQSRAVVSDYGIYEGPLGIFGAHNRKNAGLATKIALQLGVSMPVIESALAKFHGTWRRMEFKGEFQGAPAYDDYAHHPSEIQATLAALRAQYPEKRLITVFEPHQYSRTRYLLEGFATAFTDADHVIIPGIYQVRDSAEDVEAVSGQSLADEIAKNHPSVEFCASDERVVERLRTLVGPDSVLVVMGAGPIDRLFTLL